MGAPLAAEGLRRIGRRGSLSRETLLSGRKGDVLAVIGAKAFGLPARYFVPALTEKRISAFRSIWKMDRFLQPQAGSLLPIPDQKRRSLANFFDAKDLRFVAYVTRTPRWTGCARNVLSVRQKPSADRGLIRTASILACGQGILLPSVSSAGTVPVGTSSGFSKGRHDGCVVPQGAVRPEHGEAFSLDGSGVASGS
jgi:hypothetical protein